MTGPKGIEGFDKLSPAKQKLLLARMEEARRKREAAGQGSGGEDASGESLPRSPLRDQTAPGPGDGRSPAFPLSFSQRRLWFLDRLEPGSTLFTLIDALRLSGPLEVPALAAALSEIVRRHEALRTAFEAAPGGEPAQRVLPPRPVPLPVVDVAALPPPAAEAELRRLADAEVRRPFDVPRGPHLRALLVRLAPEEHGALLTVHHIVSDGWSMGVLVRELTALYGAFAEGRPSPLPELRIQYPDFADWQRHRLSGEGLEQLLGYWKEQLAGAPTLLELPADRPRPPVQTVRGTSVRRVLSPELTAAAGQLARRGGETLFMVLLAAYGAVLARHTGQDDLLVGSPVANRNRLDVEGLIGFFVNLLTLRVDLRGARSFAGLLERVRHTTLGAYAHQDLPFERLVEELQPARDLSRTPLFQTTLTLQNAPVGELRLRGLSFAPLPVELEVSQFDFSVEMTEGAEGLIVDWRFNTDLFDAGTLERLAGRFEILLAAATAEPERPLDDLPLLGEAERRQLLVEWNPAVQPEDGAAGRRLHDLFAAAAAAAPGAEALVAGDERLTYAELAARSGRLARRLADLGVGPEVRVAVCLPRTADTVVSFLGVVQAGGVHVAIDPQHPEARRAWLLRDSGARLLISRGEPGAAGEAAGIPVVDPAAPGGDDPAGGPFDGRFDGGATADNLAYLIYTSGSTGEPKGVTVPHRAAVAHVEAVVRAYGLSPRDRVLLFASFSFDVSVEQTWAPLAAGAALVLRGDELPSPQRMSEYLVQRGATLSNLPTAFWHQWVATGTAGAATTLRLLIVGGEAMAADAARHWARTAPPGVTLLNGYGPTETVVTPTLYDLENGAGAGPAVPIGWPVGARTAYVLDRLGRLAPVGAAGELMLGGILARGYLDRPALTAERFVPDPFGTPGDRLYRTGDLVKRRPDGSLEYLGRMDRQLKIRGIRVEPSEVEALLAAHPAVRQAAVEARPGPDGLARLVAWVAPAEEGDPVNLPAVLRASLRERLPEALIPSVFVVLDALPVTPAGKLDRAALREPASPAASPAANLTANLTATLAGEVPAAGLERDLAAIWKELLGVEAVGLDDNFFDLGGHSLLLAQLQDLLRERLGADVPLLDLFRFPNVRALARHLDQLRKAGAEPEAEELLEAARRRPAVPERTREIAIVGLAGRFPGAADLDQLWANLRAGVESVRTFTPEELRAAGTDPETPGLVAAGGVLDGADRFDARFFEMSPREAQLTDPQQRVFLELCAEALDAAGYGAGSPALDGPRVGVYAGTGSSHYALRNLLTYPAAGMELGIGNETDYLATRVAYKLDLRGPAFTVQTACSTSLVAVHLACKGLLDGECDLALAGGVGIHVPQEAGYVYQEGGINSASGHTRSFDARADGTVGGNGAGVVLLKPLAAARADGDVIHAVIKATALNNDGAGKVGFTAPSEDGQARVIAEAQALAGIHPDTVRFVEAHGSATALGDPIEMAALARAFRAGGGTDAGLCAVGSVKSNFGHTGSAAGIAGLLKAVLALRHREIPPSLHFETPNPRIDFASGPFYVPTALEPWEARDGVPRRAGVSSFGLGGTNVHAVLEEAPEPLQDGPGEAAREWQLLTLSARTPTTLEAATDALAAALPGVDPADATWTLHLGRKAFEHRRVLVCRDAAEAATALRERDPQRLLGAALQAETGRPVAFVFAGLGEQYPGMAAGLYRGEAAFRAAFDACAEAFLPRLGEDLRTLLFPAGPEREKIEREKTGGLDLKGLLGRGTESAPSPLDRTRLLQPALFALEYALAQLWREWGIVPQALIGYSLGEYVAACLSGVLSLDDAVFLVAERARLVDELPEGAMLAVPLPEEEIGGWLEGDLGLAAVNGPRLSVVAGPLPAVAALEERLAAAGHATRRLRTTHAFHCAMMRPAAERLAELARRVELRAPAIPYLSNVTGTWITPEQATDPGYWAEHLCATVRFGAGLGELWREPGRVLLEIGPGGSLSALALQHPATEGLADPVAVASLPSAFDRQPDAAFLLGTLGKLWLAGVEVDWRGFHGRETGRRRVVLPPYPFERQRYWVDPASAPAAVLAPRLAAGPAAYLPAWRRALPPAIGDLAGRWLIFADAGGLGGLGERLAARLERAGAEAVLVEPGERLEPRGPGRFALDPARGEDYAELLWALDGLPDRVVHLWSLDVPGSNGGAARVHERGVLSLLSLVHALALRATPGASSTGPLRALIVTSGLQRVTAADPFRPELAPLLSLAQALPLEMPGVVCRTVDAGRPAAGSWQEEKLVEALLAELAADGDAADAPVAWRGGERWVRSFEPLPPPPTSPASFGPEGAVVRLGADEEAGRAALEQAAAAGPVATVVVDLDLDAPAQPLPLLRRDQAEAVLAATSRRLEALAGWLEGLDGGHRPGRIVLLTSLEPYAPEPGAMLRAAVQELASAFAEERFAAGAMPWTAVAWDREEGAGPDPDLLARLLGQGPVARLAVSAREPEAWRHREEAAPAASAEGFGLHARPSLRNPYVAPRSETEQAVVDTWRRLLGLEEVGIHDSFFDLGGDSLLATQVMTRIREGFGVQVPLPEFFERPTPAALAERIEASGPSRPAADIAALVAQLEDLSPEEVERMLAERGVSLDDLGD